MVEVEYLHVCDYAFSAEGAKPCIIGVFDRITTHSFPTTHASMAVAVQLRGTPHEPMPVKLELSGPNGEVLVALEGHIPASEGGGAFVSFALINTQFPEAGRYTFRISSEGRSLKSQVLSVSTAQGGFQPPPPPSSSKHMH